MATLTDFIEYLEQQVDNHSIYVWGAQGQNHTTITKAWIKTREKNNITNTNKAYNYWQKQVKAGYEKVLRAFDCSGLGMYWLQNLTKTVSSDMNSNGMMGKCTMLKKAELKKGDWVFRVYKSGSNKGKAYHIGYVVDDGLNVVEARGRAYGVQKRTLNAGGTSYWTHYGRPSYFKKEIEAGPKPVTTTKYTFARLLKKTKNMMRGEDVKELQRLLVKAGYSPGSIDGVFGSHTKTAVRAYQKAMKLKVDGVAGENTITALGGVWKG